MALLGLGASAPLLRLRSSPPCTLDALRVLSTMLRRTSPVILLDAPLIVRCGFGSTSLLCAMGCVAEVSQ